jgi:hypothetical protein
VNNQTNTTQTITKSLDLSGFGDLGVVSLGGMPSHTQVPRTTVTLSHSLGKPIVTVV